MEKILDLRCCPVWLEGHDYNQQVPSEKTVAQQECLPNLLEDLLGHDD